MNIPEVMLSPWPKWIVGCGCGFFEKIHVQDKRGWLCSACNRLYDVSVDGKIVLSPLHALTGKQATVTGPWLSVCENNHEILNVHNI